MNETTAEVEYHKEGDGEELTLTHLSKSQEYAREEKGTSSPLCASSELHSHLDADFLLVSQGISKDTVTLTGTLGIVNFDRLNPNVSR